MRRGMVVWGCCGSSMDVELSRFADHAYAGRERHSVACRRPPWHTVQGVRSYTPHPFGAIGGEFRKRMFAVSDPMPDFEPVGVEHLRGELESISRMGVNDPAREDDICVWDKVIVSKSDRIIPFAGQMEAWHGHPDMTVTVWCAFS